MDTKKCRRCREEIQIDAIFCKHCKSDIRLWHYRHPIISLALLLFGSLSVIGFFQTTGMQTSGFDKVLEVNKRDYSGEWPFVDGIEKITVMCSGTAVFIQTQSGDIYPIEGTAHTQLGHQKLYPYEAGIVKQYPLFPEDPSAGMIYYDMEGLKATCSQ